MSAAAADLEALQKRLEDEEGVYAGLLAALDGLARFPPAPEMQPDQPGLLRKLNTLLPPELPPPSGGLGGWLRRRAYAAVAPALQRQAEWNAALVQLLNASSEETARLHSRLRELVSALVQFLQRVLPVMDARDRVASALATTRSELILEAFDRRQEMLGRRLTGLLALRDRLETLSEEVRALGAALDGAAPSPELQAAAAGALRDASYAAFEKRFRGDEDALRERFRSYAELFREHSPIVDLGCGRGEFLQQLKAIGAQARGVDGNKSAARECRRQGLDVVHGDLVAFLKGEKRGSLGGIFAAQVAEHLLPAQLQELLAQAHRVLRPEGLLLLETVNPRSLVGFLEVYNRDLTHERPLHPDTLCFLTAAAGFSDVRVELKSEVEPAARLQLVPPAGLPAEAVQVLNENVSKLNALLYGPLEYALLARR